MADDLIALVEEMDRCWLERRFSDLASFLAGDIVVVAPDGERRLQGREAAVDSYRDFMRRSEVLRFKTSNHHVVRRQSTAVVDYRWEMDWATNGTNCEGSGREIVILARHGGTWQVMWRAQISD